MSKTIPTTIGILIIVLLAGGVAGATFFLYDVEKDIVIEEIIPEEVIVDEDEEEKEGTFVDVIMVPVIDGDASMGLGEEIGYDTEAMRKAKERGDYIGCGDKISYIEKEIEPTSRPLKAIYLELFKGDEIVEGTDCQNPLSYHIKERSIETEKETYIVKPLEFNRVALEENKAKVYLSGEYATVGTCEPPRTEAVLKFASLQYPWIDDAIIYLNGEEMEFIHGGKD